MYCRFSTETSAFSGAASDGGAWKHCGRALFGRSSHPFYAQDYDQQPCHDNSYFHYRF
jgi:hypothetical protein